MENTPREQAYFAYTAKILILFAVYFVLARFGLGISPVSGFATLVWPPTGVALAALFLFGFELWPAIFVGAFLVNLLTGAPLVAALSIGLGNTLEALGGSYLLKRFGFKSSLERLKDVIMLIIFASMASTAVSATIGVTTLLLARIVFLSSYAQTWTAWWIGDMLGALIIAPFLFVWLSKSWQKVEVKKVSELIIVSLLLVGASVFIFSDLGGSISDPSLLYIIFPLMIWLAIRFNPKTVVTLTLIISVIAIYGTVGNLGPFAGETTSDTLFQLQLFMAAFSMTMLILASLIAERRQIEAVITESHIKPRVAGEERPLYGKRDIILVEWLRGLSVNRKLSIIIVLIIFILVFGVANFWLGMKVMSSIRAYVQVEGLWSKAQKEASNSLINYSISLDESDYNAFLKFLQVNLGDKQARLELEKRNPDLNIVRQGFIQGRNDPGDVNDLIFLYRWFRHASYMEKAIQIWTQGDEKIEELLGIGERIRMIASVPYNQHDPIEQRRRGLQMVSLIAEADAINDQLTVLEDSFSTTLGEGSRSVQNILLLITVLLSLVLGAFVLSVAVLIKGLIIQVDNAKTEFVSLASHQLRTPSTAIKWYSQMLESEGPLNEKQKKYITEIYHGNERMIKLINNLLSVARIEMGKLKIAKEFVDLRKLTEDVIKEQQMEIAKKHQTVTITQSGEIPKVFTDPVLLMMILQNLISNAVKYTLKNGMITCAIKNRVSSVLFEISDDGIGISPEDQQKVFEKLFRGSNAMEQRKEGHNREGTGLGLYIVKKIVGILGGRIWFKSKLDKGTTFYLELPMKS